MEEKIENSVPENKLNKKQEKFNKKFNSNKLSDTKILSGFIITCNHDREKNALKDAYNFLNENVEKIYPTISKKDNEIPDLEKKQKLELAEENKEKEKEKIIIASDNLEKELNNLKKKDEKYFYNQDIGVKKGVVFVKINPCFDISPIKIANKIMEDVHINKSTFSRFCHRMVPIEKAFKVNLEDYKKYILEMINNYFPKDRPCSWFLEYKCRNNNKYHKKDFLEFLLENMSKENFVSYSEPEFTIYIEINQQTLCLSVLSNYFQYKKYSLHHTIIQDEKKKNPVFSSQKNELQNEFISISNLQAENKSDSETEFKLL